MCLPAVTLLIAIVNPECNSAMIGSRGFKYRGGVYYHRPLEFH